MHVTWIVTSSLWGLTAILTLWAIFVMLKRKQKYQILPIWAHIAFLLLFFPIELFASSAELILQYQQK